MIRFNSIESLRAWMAWWVVVGHALHLAGFSTKATDSGEQVNILLHLLLRGGTAVNVFIIISGFVIAHLLITKHEAYKNYIVRRWFRLFPIFLFSLTLAILLKPLYLAAYTEFSWVYAFEMRIERANLEDDNFFKHLILHLTMLHGIIPEEILKYASSSFLAPAWSLSLEWQFYLLAPFLVFAISRSLKLTLIITFVSLSLFYWINDVSAFSWKYNSFLLLSMPHFLIGIASRFLIENFNSKRLFWVLVTILPCFLGDKLAVIIWFIFVPILMYEANLTKLPRVFTPITNILFFNVVIQTLGKWSYSTYLIHIQIFSIFVGGFVVINNGNLTQPVAWLLILIACIVTVPVSWLLYKTIEKPFIKIGAKLTQKS
ncbi:acyltransferase [Paraglaciecola aquimarina]|uniref:Acyltransferase n=1 Tax=Paraglaciecola algarum TaxID=3050085 RepID=A0ABS9DE69_9ALTE|nr:acyltransferase [Paraglaciecola sp. G1-23]MCF2949886.1 acyltransferase [Paraglaciecola sp. G1-23]